MSNQTASHPRKLLADFVESIEASENPEQELLNRIIDHAREKDAELAEAIRYCAIPRRFDAEVIGILRKASNDYEGNNRLLADLRDYSFVLPRQDSGYVYHDNTRDLLLEYWRTADDWRDQFDQFNQQLATFYEAQYEKAQHLERNLRRVASVVQKAGHDRYVQLASIVETRIIAPLLEALYHETLHSAEAGYNFFTRYCEAYEAVGRPTVCESLLNAARDYLERLPPNSGQRPWLKWLRYWEARLARQASRNAEAETILRGLLPQAEEDTKLKLWVLGELGATLHQQNKLREAREFFERELALNQETRRDPYNLPVSYSRVANRHWFLAELDQAADKYREAIQSAQKEHNPRMEAYARLDLSGVLQDHGKWVEAFDVALEALHLAHTQFPQDYALHQSVARRFMPLLAPSDPRLLDTIFAEAVALTDMGEPFLALDLRNQYLNLLRQNGRLERAEKLLIDLREEAAGYADTSFGTDLLFHAALLREAQGRVNGAADNAIALYTQIVERAKDGRESIWHHAAALSNRGLINADRARWTEAESDLQEAIAKWEEMGHEKMAAYVRVFLAIASRQQGHLSKAQKLLDEAWGSLGGTHSSYLADHHQARGDAYRDQARWMEAREQYQQALTINRSLDLFNQAA